MRPSILAKAGLQLLQLVHHELHRWRTVPGVLADADVDEVVDLPRHVATQAAHVRRILVEDRGHTLADGNVSERGDPGEHLGQDDSEGIDVGRTTLGDTSECFRGQVVERAVAGFCGVRQDPRETEVQDFRPTVGGERDVLRLQIAMDNTMGVGNC